MHRLALIGVSHRRGGATALESWQEWFGARPEPSLREAGLSEFVPLVTCNRFDVLTAVPDGVSAEEVRARLTPPYAPRRPYLFVGEAALEQLTRITASLDSVNPGEDQIHRQVREAYRRARAQGTAGKITGPAFETALRIARRVRHEVPLAPVNTSLFSLAVPLLREELRPGDTVILLGAGEMAAWAAQGLGSLKGLDIRIVNRGRERGQELAGKTTGASFTPLEEFLNDPPVHARALVAATSAAGLIGEEFLGRLPELRVIVDLGMPRNVARAGRSGLLHLDVDDLAVFGNRRREELSQRIAQAQALLHELLDEALGEWAERELAPSITKLRELYYRTVAESLPEEEARRIAHRFAHVPIKGLRAVAREHGLAAAQTYLNETGLLE